ncbi:unnamed protein product [Adineta ricciae]|uniref:Uncharacterized protein n=1 Tax=Adineta ricciae TaxID=249248 RepID=A0A814PC43_ADIRI|nr:unnamed protein product [Adineta ricciae]CAF1532822.1 unnamed protein product [Adineta ricciae]
MATISKESLAQFWLSAFPPCDNYDYLSFSDAASVSNLLEFISEKNEEKKIFELINSYIQEMKPKQVRMTIEENSSSKRRRSTKNTLINIDTNRVRFAVNVDVVENLEYDEEIISIADDSPIEEDRTMENLTTILHESNSTRVVKCFQTLIYPWLIDLSFNIPNDFFSLLVELMNKSSDAFFLHCFIPWLRSLTTDTINQFFTNLFTQLTNLSDRCKLCCYLCQNSTCPFNMNELSLISKWFDSKEFYFSNDLLNFLPEKVAISATIFSDNLPFAKVLHKILIKCTENDQILTNEQRLILKQAVTINTTILSDILLDLLD